MDIKVCTGCEKDVDIDAKAGFAYVMGEPTIEHVPSRVQGCLPGDTVERKTPGKPKFYHHQCAPPSASASGR